MDTILKFVGGGGLAGLGIFLAVFFIKARNKNNDVEEVFPEVANPDKYKILNAEQKVLKWEEYQKQLKKRRK